jgi:hypothetical protein
LGLCSGRSWKDQTAHSRRSVSSCCRQACAWDKEDVISDQQNQILLQQFMTSNFTYEFSSKVVL